jgi:hypothetical protein
LVPEAGIVALVAMVGCADGAKEPVAKKPPIETRRTVGETTQNVLEWSAAMAAGGVPAEMAATGPGLEAYADAYRATAGSVGMLAVEQKMKLHEAEHGSTPDTYEAFMERIIGQGRADGIRLPMLPYYQEYAFDPKRKTVVVVEFPAKKEQRRQETTGAAGL